MSGRLTLDTIITTTTTTTNSNNNKHNINNDGGQQFREQRKKKIVANHRHILNKLTILRVGRLKSLHTVDFSHDHWGFLFEEDIVGTF